MDDLERSEWTDAMVADYTAALKKENRKEFFARCRSYCKAGPNDREVVPIYDDDQGLPEKDETIQIRYIDNPNDPIWDVVSWYITP